MRTNHTPCRLVAFTTYAQPEIRTESGVLVAVLKIGQEADAIRLVSCWNSLIDLPQEALDGGWTRAGLEAYGIKMQRQRDTLLAALQAMLDEDDGGMEAEQARAAIAAVTGNPS